MNSKDRILITFDKETLAESFMNPEDLAEQIADLLAVGGFKVDVLYPVRDSDLNN